MLTSRSVVALLLVWLLQSGALLAGSQASSGAIAGRVADSSGGVIAGARVTVRGATGRAETTVSDARGEFVVTGITPGSYVVSVERKEFDRAVHHVTLAAAQPRVDLRVVLNPSGVSEHVIVDGPAAAYAAPETTTAGKVPVERRYIANSVSVLTRQQIEEQNLVTTWDALSQMTGVTAVSNDGTQSQFHARGGALESQHDGVPSAMPLSGYQQYDLAIYDRIEVVRGPAGVLQGAGSFSGVVNLVPKRPGATRSVAAWASTGQWRNHHAEAEVAGPIGPALRGLAVIAATDRQFFYDRGEDKKWLGHGVIEWHPNTATMFGVTVSHQKDRTPGFTGLPTYTDGRFLDVPRSFNPYPVWNRMAWDTTDVGVDFERGLGARWKITAKVNRRAQDFLFHDAFPDEGVNPSTQSTAYARREFDVDYATTSADAYLSGRFNLLGRGQEWVAGANISRFESESRGMDFRSDPTLIVRGVPLASPPNIAEPTFTPRTGSGSRTEQSGFYSLLRSRVTGRITTALGTRWSNYKQHSRSVAPSAPTDWVRGLNADLEFTPYGGVVVDATRAVSLYASYSEIFVPQSQRQVDGNVLDPRVGHQWEVGAKGEHLNKRLLTALALFDIRDRNRSYPDTRNPGFFVPLGEVESKGFEAEVTGQVTPYWDVSTGYTWLDTELVTHPTLAGDPISFWYPKHALKAWSLWRVPAGRMEGLRVGVGVQAYGASASGRDTVSATGVVTVAARRQSAYVVATANCSYSLSRHLQLSVQVSNLFDTSYYTRLGGTNTYNTFGEPRNATVSVRWRL